MVERRPAVAGTRVDACACVNQCLGVGECPRQVGEDTIVTSGFEYMDVGLPISRVVVGGTGAYVDADGVQQQTLLGFNNADLVIDDIPFFGLAWTTDLPTG